MLAYLCLLVCDGIRITVCMSLCVWSRLLLDLSQTLTSNRLSFVFFLCFCFIFCVAVHRWYIVYCTVAEIPEILTLGHRNYIACAAHHRVLLFQHIALPVQRAGFVLAYDTYVDITTTTSKPCWPTPHSRELHRRKYSRSGEGFRSVVYCSSGFVQWGCGGAGYLNTSSSLPLATTSSY